MNYVYSPRPLSGSGLFTLDDMSIIRMNMFTSILARVVTQSQGDRGNPRSPEAGGKPGARGTGMLQPRPYMQMKRHAIQMCT